MLKLLLRGCQQGSLLSTINALNQKMLIMATDTQIILILLINIMSSLLAKTAVPLHWG